MDEVDFNTVNSETMNDVLKVKHYNLNYNYWSIEIYLLERVIRSELLNKRFIYLKFVQREKSEDPNRKELMGPRLANSYVEMYHPLIFKIKFPFILKKPSPET